MHSCMHKQQVPLRIEFSTAAGSGDWARQLNAHTNASSLEKIEDGQLLESSSVAAALLELEVRFDLAASKIQLVPPHVTVTLCSADGLLLQQKEREEFLSQLCQKAQLFFVIWSEARHYTLLHLSRKMGDSHYTTTYMDSLRAPAKGNIVVAKQLLCNLGLNSEATALVPSNTEFQGDGWSCGIWCIKWTEQVLRRLRNEVPVFEGPSIHDIVVRTNEFIIAALQANEAKSLSTSASASLVSDTLKDGAEAKATPADEAPKDSAAAPAAAAEAQPEGAPEAQPCRSQLCTASPCSIHGEYDACEHCEHCQQWVREMDSNADARAAASEPAAGSRAAAEAPNNGAAAPAAAAEAKPEEAKTEDVKAAPADEALPSAEPAAVAPVAAAEAPKDGAAAAAPAPEEAKATPAAEAPKDGAAAPAALEEAKVTPAAEALKEDLAAPALEKQEEAEAEQAKPEGATAEESQANDQTAAAIEDKAPQKTSRKPQPVSAKAKAKAKALETPEKPARTASQDHNKDNVGVIKEGTFKPLSAFMKPAAGGGPKKIQQQEDTSTAAAKKRSQKKEQESEATPPPKKRRGQGEAAAGTGTA